MYAPDAEVLEEFLDAAETLSVASSADLGSGASPPHVSAAIIVLLASMMSVMCTHEAARDV